MSAAPLASVPLAVNGAPCLLHRVRFRSAADGAACRYWPPCAIRSRRWPSWRNASS